MNPVTAGNYLALEREWRDGDTIELRLPMSLRVRPAMDDAKLVSFFYGPVLLAGALGTQDMPASDTTTSPQGFHNRPVPPVPMLASIAPTAMRAVMDRPLHFAAPLVGGTNQTRSVEFIPFYELHHQRYSLYWRAN